MKKYLRILAQIILISTLSSSTIACGRIIGGGGTTPGEPEEPQEKDIEYYQNLIAESEEDIAAYKEAISDTEKEIEDGNLSEEEIAEQKINIDQMNAEINSSQAAINEYQYQILLLKAGGKITIGEKAEAIIYLTAKIEKLKQELTIKTKYPDDYSQAELDEIEIKIKDTETTLKEIVEIEDGNDDKFNFK